MTVFRTRKFWFFLTISMATAILLVPTGVRWGYFIVSVLVTTCVLFNLFLFSERARLLYGKFDVYDEVIFPCRGCSALSTYVVAVPGAILFTLLLPFLPAPHFQMFWIWYTLFGFWLSAWNYGTKLIVPKAGTIATKNGILYKADNIIIAPLFYPQISLESVSESEAEDDE